MNKIYEVRGKFRTDGRVTSRGVFRTRAEAEQHLRSIADETYVQGYWVEEIDTTDLFQVPTKPTPRERYTTRVYASKGKNTWTTVHVEVLDGDEVVAEYDRDYEMLDTFEPFRQGDRMFALVSPHYTATSVLDLHTGEIVATEEPDARGFCPVGFYVPDWWDINSDKVLPGALDWRPVDHEWPTGEFGFVWGCVWGDDGSWKVQHLDLSGVRDGVIRRDDRYGYLKLATAPGRVGPDIIKCSTWRGERRVEFHVQSHFIIESGLPILDDEL
jgi:hypothetical protein